MGGYWFKKKLLLSAILFGMVVIFSVCIGDGDKGQDCSEVWSSELQEEIDDVSKASQIFENNPNEITCKYYKVSLQNYLKALKNYEDCAGLSGQERAAWQQEWNQAKDNVNSLDLLSYY